MRWRCTYAGQPNKNSAAGVAQPSWRTFDKRVWERGCLRIELVNLHRRPPTPRKIAAYRVTLSGPRGEMVRVTGHDWQRLVREIKREAREPSGAAGLCAGTRSTEVQYFQIKADGETRLAYLSAPRRLAEILTDDEYARVESGELVAWCDGAWLHPTSLLEAGDVIELLPPAALA